MKHKIKVVLKETEDRTSKIWLDNDNNKLLFDPLGVMNCNPMYAYTTVLQDIEPSDWFIYRNYNLMQCTGPKQILTNNEIAKHNDYGQPQSLCRKIIATTDPKLYNYVMHSEGRVKVPIPQLSQSFLKEYVANPDGEYEVEYELRHHDPDYKCTACETGDSPLCGLNELKLNQDNTVNITPVEACEHPFKRLHWIGSKVYCNKCSTTLVKPLEENL